MFTQLLVDQSVHSVHCANFYLRTSKKLNKYYFKLPYLHTQSWIFLMIPPPPATATQILHDEPQKSKPIAETIKPSNNTNENIELFKKVTASTTTKHKQQSSISDLVMLTKGKNESSNNNKEHEGQDVNVKSTICNRRIEHATTATIENNRFTTKCTLDIRPEKKMNQSMQPKFTKKSFEAIKHTDDTAVIITLNKTRTTNSNTFPTDEEHQTSDIEMGKQKVKPTYRLKFERSKSVRPQFIVL